MTDFIKHIHHLDKDLTLSLNSMHCELSDSIWQFFSNAEIWYVLYLAVAVFLFRNLGWKRALLSILAIALTFLFCDQMSNVTKVCFARLRPCWDGDMVAGCLQILESKGGLYGFYSAHAANAMGFAICSLTAFRSDRSRKYVLYGIFIILWALLVGVSRVFVGKHFLGDVFTGFVVGAVAGWVFARLSRLVKV